jgi:uncharacterized membrane protein
MSEVKAHTEKDTARLEAFSDGVFGIAMTLLVIEFKVPRPPQDVVAGNWWLLTSLARLWPSFISFTLSFGTVLIMWINHHGLFKHAHRADNRLLFANGLLLLNVTFVPFPTAVLAAYLNTPSANAAAMFYCATYVLIGLSYNLLLSAVLPNRALDVVGSPPHEIAIARIRRAYRVGLIMYVAAALIATFSAFGGLAICLSLWGVWVLLNYSPGHRSSA